MDNYLIPCLLNAAGIEPAGGTDILCVFDGILNPFIRKKIPGPVFPPQFQPCVDTWAKQDEAMKVAAEKCLNEAVNEEQYIEAAHRSTILKPLTGSRGGDKEALYRVQQRQRIVKRRRLLLMVPVVVVFWTVVSAAQILLFC